MSGDQARVSVAVAVPPKDAFDIFTGEIDRWWRRGPKFRHAGGRGGFVRLEPHVGGRLFESIDSEHGERIFEVGRVRVVTIAPGFIDTAMTAGNPYPMPFLMTAESFARLAVKAILRGDAYQVIPWQMAWLARVLRVLPNRVFDRIMQGRARKPRIGSSA